MTKPRERGAVTVEFALILPVFFIIVLAIVEFGIRYERNAELNNAAFIAARNMAINNDTAEATAAATAAGMPGSASISIGSCASPGDDITVTINVTEDSPTKAFGSTFDVEGVGVARCEQ
jgi:Flp pilus assembly protein TadG